MQPSLHSTSFLRNFANKDQSSMLGVVRKENHLRYISNLAVNGHPQELGDNAIKAISSSGTHSKIVCNNRSVAPQPTEGSISHCWIVLEDGLDGYVKYVKEV